MKSRKLFALALSGVLAVSMLAGCGDAVDEAHKPLRVSAVESYLDKNPGADKPVTVTEKTLESALSPYNAVAKMWDGTTPEEFFESGVEYGYNIIAGEYQGEYWSLSFVPVDAFKKGEAINLESGTLYELVGQTGIGFTELPPVSNVSEYIGALCAKSISDFESAGDDEPDQWEISER